MQTYTDLADFLLSQADKLQPSTGHAKALDDLAAYISRKFSEGQTPQLNFVCTHNSRRSHMSQIMAQVLAAHLKLDIKTWSGGTEATEFHANAVNALRELGVQIEKISEGANARYRVTTGLVVSEAFSKKFSAPPNPQKDFAAIMVCSSADAGCPFVPGADVRISLPFKDPKVSDGTEAQASVYRERALQIGAELAYMFKRINFKKP